MKTTSKYLGLFLVLVLALTLVGFQASGVAAGDQKFTKGPNAQIKDQGRLLSTLNILAYDVAPDGKTIATGGASGSGGGIRAVHKSSNGGDSFPPPKTLPAAVAPSTDASAIVAIAFSPDYATDKTIYVATSLDLYRSTDDSNTYNAFSGAFANITGISAGTHTITSMDVGKDSAGNTVIAIGTDGTAAAAFGEVWVYRSDVGSWVDQNVARNTGVAATLHAPHAANTTEVLAVAFSPNFTSDGVLFAFVTGDEFISTADPAGDPARVVSKWSNFNNSTFTLWGANWFDSDNILTGTTFTSASFAFPADFDVINTGKNFYYLGLVSATAIEGDAFRIAGWGTGSGNTASKVQDLGLNVGVKSVAFSGNISGGTLLVGQNASGTVQRTADTLSNTPTWTPATKSPPSVTGQTPAVMVKAAGSSAWAVSQGEHGGFHKSTDGGVVFNGTAHLRTTVNAITDFAVSPTNTKEIIAVTQDTAAPAGSNVWRTTDNGDKWVRVWLDATAVDTIDAVKLSPTYDKDKTFFLGDTGGTRIWRTSDSGNTFFGVSAPLSAANAGFTAIAVESATNLIAGYGNGEVHRSTTSGLTWVKSITGAGSKIIRDILINPKDAKEVFTANSSGQVNRSRDNAVTFRKLEGEVSGADATTNATLALADGYDPTRLPVVFVGTNLGIFRQRIGTELVWLRISATTTSGSEDVNGLAVYAVETLSATSATATSGAITRTTNAQRLDADTRWARATFNDGGVTAAAITTKLLRAVTARTGTTLFLVETSSGSDTIYSYNDNMSQRIALGLPRSKSSVLDTDRLTFNWTGIKLPDGAVYRLVVSFDSGFDQQLGANNDTEGTTFRLVSAALEPGKTYFWYVQARLGDDSGDTITSPRGRHSAVARGVTTYVAGEFSTGVARPALVSPIGGALTGGVGAPLKPVLQWGQVEGANRYELQVDTSASFFAPFVNLTDTGRLDSTAYQIDKDLEYSTTYYWRVRAATFTSLGEWSTVGAFTTMAKPVPPAPPITIQAPPPAPIINIPAPTTPSWVWVVIVIGAILVIVMLVLIVRTRRV